MQSHSHTGANPSHDPTNPAGTGATHMKNEIMHPKETKAADQQTRMNEQGGAYGAGATGAGAGYGNTAMGNTGVGAAGTGLGGATGTHGAHHGHGHHTAEGAALGAGAGGVAGHHGHHTTEGAALGAGAGGVAGHHAGEHHHGHDGHASGKDLKEAQKLEKSGERQQKIGSILHSTSMQEKGAAKQAEAQNIAQGGAGAGRAL